MTAIFCDSPFQLMCAVNIARNYLHEDGCVLFLMREMYNSRQKFLVQDKDGFIKKVHYVRRTPKKLTTPHRKAVSLWCRLRRLDRESALYLHQNFYGLPPWETSFTSVICDRYGVGAAYLLRYQNRSCPFYIIEEGVGEYFVPPCRGDLFTLPVYSSTCASVCRLYFWPEFFRQHFPEVDALSAPPLSARDAEYNQCIDSLFGTGDIKLPPAKCIYFHQPLDAPSLPNATPESIAESVRREQSILQLLQKKYGDRFYIKLHPRDDPNAFSEYRFLQTQAPWESLLHHFPNVSDLVLLGINTTALLTPKMMYNAEPAVFCLERLLNPNILAGSSTNYCSIFEYMRTRYTNPGKVCIPDTMEALISALQNTQY